MTTLVAGTNPINVLSAAGTTLLTFLTRYDATAFRATCQEARDAVADQPWAGAERITGSLAAWRACFPRSTNANLCWRGDICDDDLVHLRGVPEINMDRCTKITDAGIAHIAGVKRLNIDCVRLITNAAFVHLEGIKWLSMDGCNQPTVTDDALAHLAGIHTLTISWCPYFTDAGIAHLAGIKNLTITSNPILTDACLVHLKGIHTLDANWCTGIKGTGFHNIRGIKSLSIAGTGGDGLTALESLEHLDIRFCYWARNDLFCNLKKLKTLRIGGCDGLTWGFLKNIPEEALVERFTKWETRAAVMDVVTQIRGGEHWSVRC